MFALRETSWSCLRAIVTFDIKDARGAAMRIVRNHQCVTVPFLADEIAPVMSAGEGSPYQETHP
jgi:hypothetical protein